ncbi:MAG TPA: hypothetical protein VNG12_12975 [Acidimicrobiales bacterium]|nr:hypothetical protein [Acidimicrobiales bacterium]
MKAITVRQPWAGLIIDGLKFVENRPKPTLYRGPLLIHAGLRLDESQRASWAPRSRHTEEVGVLLGTVEMIECFEHYPSSWAVRGMSHWVLADPRPFRQPIPWRGQQGFFEVPDRHLPLRATR